MARTPPAPRPDATVVYTDGGARPNPGPGAWAAVIVEGGETTELVGGEDHTTNNRMELSAAIAALEHLAPGKVDLYTDSTYVRQGITSWLPVWVARNWERRQGGAVKNQDLWKRLAGAAGRHDVSWIWVKGHAGHELNERADALATAEIERRGGATDTPPTEPATAPETDAAAALTVRCVGRTGGWAVRVTRGGTHEDLQGRDNPTSANRLALLGALAVLDAVGRGESLLFESGSDYLRQGATEWLSGWRARGWKTASGDDVKNRDLWIRVARGLEGRTIVWRPLDKTGATAKELKKSLRG